MVVEKEDSIDSDERDLIENISWDTDSDEEDIFHDDEIVDKLNKRIRDGLIDDSHGSEKEEEDQA